MIRALIADDEALARRLIVEYLHAHGDISVAAECDNGLEAARLIGTLQPDLVFLDIQMPKLTGLEVLEATGRRHGVVFTTAYDQHALQAFDLHAVDYLLKPFSQARFDAALKRARALLSAPQAALEPLVTEAATRLERIVIRDREQIHIVPVEKIDYIEAQDDYVAIHAEGRSYLKNQRLSELEEKLDRRAFLRVHRSYLINLSCVQAIERSGKDNHVARLRGGASVPISRAGYERIREAM
ncbi:LytTR family DNA-binding domain-containing protein [Chromobacterium sp. IIBBL 290-4]|uniref:LytR/AlgR family response regulator transcription factor n=1 Tax=Chromobacterium sp. IIBBL 290-4 TaxID=2953890 RepID=UPI0020B66CBB|nr:LytTR family DNA-binding domain-containing protein [Chromobacterium sp. IIBBL 290-4]UTH73549.1 LytTR family DNA-binding domain-containing protein [Chromobacterium sp. IIBBL 290-4]